MSDALDLADFDFRTPLPTNLRKRQVVSPYWVWGLSPKTLGINQALSNTYLKFQGLYELRDGWINLMKRPVRSRMQGVAGAEG